MAARKRPAKRKKSDSDAKAPQSANFVSKYVYVLILLSSLAVFGQSLGFGLVYCDDYEIIVRDAERLEEGGGLTAELTTGYMTTDYYRPVVNVSFLLNSAIGGRNEFVYHLTNLLLHIVSSCLMFVLLKRLGIVPSAAAMGALIFSVHPMFANAIAWIVGRNDLLFGLFGMLSFIYLIKFAEDKKPLNLIVHAAAFLLAAFSKETALLLPLVFASYVMFVLKENLFRGKFLFLLGTWILVDVFWLFMRSISDLGENINRIGVDVFLMNLRVVPEFIGKFFVPADLSVLPTYNLLNTFLGLIVIALIIYAMIRIKDKNRALVLLGALWFLVLTLPGTFVSLHNAHEWNEYLECRAYLPAAGLLIMFLGLLPAGMFQNRLTVRLAYVLLLIFAILAIAETAKYRDEIAFYESAVADSPGRARMHDILARKYLLHDEYQKAEEQFVKSYESNPDNWQYAYNTGAHFFNTKQYQKALPYMKAAVEKNDTNKSAHIILSDVFYNLLRFDDAINILSKTLDKWPGHPDALFSMTGVYINKKEYDTALRYADSLIAYNLKKDELFKLLYNWGLHFLKKDEIGTASKFLKKAEEVKPNDKRPREALKKFFSEKPDKLTGLD